MDPVEVEKDLPGVDLRNIARALHKNLDSAGGDEGDRSRRRSCGLEVDEAIDGKLHRWKLPGARRLLLGRPRPRFDEVDAGQSRIHKGSDIGVATLAVAPVRIVYPLGAAAREKQDEDKGSMSHHSRGILPEGRVVAKMMPADYTDCRGHNPVIFPMSDEQETYTDTHSRDCGALVDEYERRLWDLTQLLEISKSLNSGLDYESLIRSYLHVCIGHMKVMRAALFVRGRLDSRDLVLHPGHIGIEVEPGLEYRVPEGHPILRLFAEHGRSYSFEQMLIALGPGADSDGVVAMLASLEPAIVAPLRSKNAVNGLLVLADRIQPDDITDGEREFLETSALLAGMAVNNAFLYEIATVDMMTRLKQRHYFLQRLQEEKDVADRRGHGFSVIMLDIDHFKRVNDQFGHLAGDAVIRAVADTVLSCMRQTDVAARYGGEEFIVLLPRTDCNQAHSLAERIRRAVSDLQVQVDGRTIRVTVSLGIAEYRSEESVRAVIRRTDAALYRAKTEGRNLARRAVDGSGATRGCVDSDDAPESDSGKEDGFLDASRIPGVL